jgi:hypothetical protein
MSTTSFCDVEFTEFPIGFPKAELRIVPSKAVLLLVRLAKLSTTIKMEMSNFGTVFLEALAFKG